MLALKDFDKKHHYIHEITLKDFNYTIHTDHYARHNDGPLIEPFVNNKAYEANSNNMPFTSLLLVQ